MLELLFIASLFVIAYIYLGYPLVLLILSALRPRPIRKKAGTPFVTILIAAYNEAQCIAGTIENKLGLEYPRDRLEIIVVSDGSTDGTDEIVRRYEASGVRLIRQEPRAGKTSALNLAVGQAAGEILVFSDANSSYAPDALLHLVENFSDPEVGYVTGKMIYTNPDGSPIGDGCTSYMKYENLLRSVETRVGSVVGVDGGIDAVCKSLYRPMNPDQLPDFVLPLKVVEQGFRVVYEPRALLREQALNQAADEYRMRVRVSLRALWALWDLRHLLTFAPSSFFSRGAPSHFPHFAPSLSSSSSSTSQLRTFSTSFLYSWQLWSHKVLRYLCFVFLIAAYLANLALWDQGWFYRLTLLGQTAAYLTSLASPLLERARLRFKPAHLARYFVLLNLASAHAFFKFIMGKKQVMWQPRKG
jgi:cellulose synthase/poly-beta-1,6-N-acetylglucosamine synthase-like glycosyltransferase